MTLLRVLPRRKEGIDTGRIDVDLVPAVDIIESKETFTIHFDLPGLEKDEIKVSVNDKVLSVTGERKNPASENETYYRYYERPDGTFSRSFKLPDHVDGNAVKASYKNGVLSLELPKKEEAKPKTIEIK